MYDAIVIGGGPAGLTAASYLSRANKRVLLLEKTPYGGQAGVLNEIVNYPGLETVTGFDLIDAMMKQARSFGAELSFAEVVSIDAENLSVTLDSGKTERAKNIVLACGCKAKALGLHGETELIGSGVSYCATCDGGFFKGKTVAVVGKSEKARESARYLVNVAKKTYFITNGEGVEGAETVRGRVSELIGKPLSAIAVTDGGETRVLQTDGLFIVVGLTPITHLIAGKALTDEDGYVIVNNDYETSAKGIFAIGDIVKKSVRQIVTAAADGAICAQAIIKRK